MFHRTMVCDRCIARKYWLSHNGSAAMKKITVNAPTNYANSMLNGSSGLLLSLDNDSGIAEVLLTTGKNAGRKWQFCLSHLSGL